MSWAHGAISLSLLSPLLLSGCGLPPAVAVASYAADGVSYMASGKTLSDHGISAATGHDCSLLRGLSGEAVCADERDRGRDIPIDMGKASAPPPGDQYAAPVPVAVAKNQYVTVGSFLDPNNAARARAHYADLHAEIVLVDVKGRSFHRVVVGPLSADEAKALKERLAAEDDTLRDAG